MYVYFCLCSAILQLQARQKIHSYKKHDFPNLILKGKACNSKDLIYINIFNGLIPIPNQYHYLPIESSENITKFTLFSGTLDKYDWPYIIFGKYNDNEINDKIDSLNKMYNDKIETYLFNDLNVLYIKTQIPELFQTIIYSNGEYIEILDEGEEIWKAMLETYRHIKVNRCK